MKTNNFMKTLNYINLRKLIKPTALGFSALFIISMLSFLAITPVQAETLTKVVVSSASASSYDGSYTPSRAIDGIESTANYWGTNALVTAGKLPQWLRLDLGAQMSISQIITHFYDGDSRVYTYYIQTSTDGSSWTTIVPTKTGTKSMTDSFTPVTARYVRITITGNTANLAAHIEEIKIYGSTTSTSTSTPTPTPTPTPAQTLEPPSTQELSALHVDGNKLKDANGNVVILRGVLYQSVRWYGDSPLPTQSQFANMRAMGCNSVNVQIWLYQLYQGHFGTGGLRNPNFLAALDNIMAWANTNNLYVVLTLLCAGPFPDGYDTNDLKHLFTTYDTFSNFLSYWQFFANRYKNYNNILYCPFGEPLDCNYNTYTSYIQQIIDTIRTYRSDAVCIVPQVNSEADFNSGMWSGVGFSFQSSNPINRNNIMFNFDPYYGHMYPTNDALSVANFLNTNGVSGLKASFPFFLAETGPDLGWHSHAYDNMDTTWLNNVFAYVDANLHGGYTVYAWEAGSATGGAILSNWNGALTTYGNAVKTYYLAH